MFDFVLKHLLECEKWPEQNYYSEFMFDFVLKNIWKCEKWPEIKLLMLVFFFFFVVRIRQLLLVCMLIVVLSMRLLISMEQRICLKGWLSRARLTEAIYVLWGKLKLLEATPRRLRPGSKWVTPSMLSKPMSLKWLKFLSTVWGTLLSWIGKSMKR